MNAKLYLDFSIWKEYYQEYFNATPKSKRKSIKDIYSMRSRAKIMATILPKRITFPKTVTVKDNKITNHE